ncbi:hypothetical protein RvY_09604 [Ramazzottius varieornatus]|uniref:Protein phosphatase methylesterase 1 n=1 Tax=Ramazzottius varieornatus TaxID=947166 RepID=A0A1D1V9U4_RAMVA|nr:hypothetical protein RvY_09604 [Ramazzottius varieornatus]
MDRKEMLKSTLPPLAKFLPPPSIPPAKRGRASFVPEPWNLYFTSQRKVTVGKNIFNVYEKGAEGPILLMVHGAGFSGLSWALFTNAMTSLLICRCIAVDLRGHGDTITDNDEDLSAEILSTDLADVAQFYLSDSTAPSIVLIGHSLGGAVCVHAASRGLIPGLAGLVVIDVVEGTALESLSMMESLVRGRPSTFPSVENAIEWSFRTGHIKNPESARVSMVGQLKPMMETSDDAKSQPDIRQTINTTETIMEDDSEQADSQVSSAAARPGTRLGWRIDLLKTQPFWQGWFTGLSEMFLSCPVPKLLILAGMDRLDKDLSIGQMQGKFQMVVLPKSGHAVQEDQPVKVAETLASFMLRNKIVSSAGEFPPVFPGC